MLDELENDGDHYVQQVLIVSKMCEMPLMLCDLCVDKSSNGDKCDCAGKQCEWFVYNHEVAIPEYIVDFEYVTSVRQCLRLPS